MASSTPAKQKPRSKAGEEGSRPEEVASAAPEPSSGPDAAVGSDGMAIWQRTVEILAEQKPLQVAWAREGAFLEIKGNAFIVGFDREHAMSAEHLERPGAKQAVEEILAGVAGRTLSIQYEVRDENQRCEARAPRSGGRRENLRELRREAQVPISPKSMRASTKTRQFRAP